jgi:hypothetical protein
MSPSGCTSYEDLPLVSSGSRDTLLIVVEERGEDMIVYRCLYGGEEQ